MLYSHTHCKEKKAVFWGGGGGGWVVGGVSKLWKTRNTSYEFVEYGHLQYNTLLCFPFIQVSQRPQQILSFCKSFFKYFFGGFFFILNANLQICWWIFAPKYLLFIFLYCIVILVRLMSEECPVMCLLYRVLDNLFVIYCTSASAKAEFMNVKFFSPWRFLGIILRVLRLLRFPYTMFTVQTSFSPLLLKGGGGGVGSYNC